MSDELGTLPYTWAMISSIYVNMPVLNVERSKEFFLALGFSLNENYSGPDNSCIVINSNISAMLMNLEKQVFGLARDFQKIRSFHKATFAFFPKKMPE